MSDGSSDLDASGREMDDPRGGGAAATVGPSGSEALFTAKRRTDCCNAPPLSSRGSQPDLDSRPKRGTQECGRMWQEVVAGLDPECPLSTAKLGHVDDGGSHVLLGPHVSTEHATSVESAMKLADGVQQCPAYLTPHTSESPLGSCDDYNADETDECPVCSESYGRLGTRRAALLNCDHTLCEGCLSKMLGRSNDPSRIQCPLCRQRTPLLHWEIRHMQEEALSNQGLVVTMSTNPSDPGVQCNSSDPVCDSLPPTTALLQQQAPGPPCCCECAPLERRLQELAESEVVCGCCHRPRWLSQVLRRSRRCQCCYVTLLLTLGMAERGLLLLVFIPVVMLVLLFTLLGR